MCREYNEGFADGPNGAPDNVSDRATCQPNVPSKMQQSSHCFIFLTDLVG
jgi:hypothetical protein